MKLASAAVALCLPVVPAKDTGSKPRSYIPLGPVTKAYTVLEKQSHDLKSAFKTFAYYSHAAYTVGSLWNCKGSCETPETHGTEIEYRWRSQAPISVGYIGRNSNSKLLVISFRGTKDTDDWIQDAEFVQDPWPPHFPGSLVHHGFLSSYQSVAHNVTSEVTRLAQMYPDHRIVFTGHSLGGAETVMCAVDLLNRRPDLKPRMHIYTYGQPRIGNDEWANRVDKLKLPIFRMVYECDMVPHVPFRWLNYRHFSEEVWIHNNQILFCGRNGENTKCSDLVSIGNYSIPDHSRYPETNWFGESEQIN